MHTRGKRSRAKRHSYQRAFAAVNHPGWPRSPRQGREESTERGIRVAAWNRDEKVKATIRLNQRAPSAAQARLPQSLWWGSQRLLPFLEMWKNMEVVRISIRGVVGLFGPTCSPSPKHSESVQVFIPQRLPRGTRTHGKRLAAKTQTAKSIAKLASPSPS